MLWLVYIGVLVMIAIISLTVGRLVSLSLEFVFYTIIFLEVNPVDGR